MEEDEKKPKENPIRGMIAQVLEKKDAEGELMTLVSDMKDEVDTMEATIANLVDEVSNKTNQIEDLRSANLSLLRKYGSMPDNSTKNEDSFEEEKPKEISMAEIVKLF